MSDVRPLVFLLTRSIVNGVKRAVTSPKRLIALLAFGLYYYQLLLRPFGSQPHPSFPAGTPQFRLPPLPAIDAVVFGLVGAMSLLLMSSILSYKGGFKAADVDVLFPTPVSPRVVLLFRIARDTIATLLLPLFVALIGYRSAAPTVAPFFRDYPRQGGDILRALVLGYLMVSLVWVCIGYAASLFVNRSDLKSDRNRKLINVGMAALIFAVLGYALVSFRLNPNLETMVGVAHNPFVRFALAPVTLATWAVMGTFQGNPVLAIIGYLGLLAIAVVALQVALTQVGWMYDQAAARGFSSGPNLRELQSKGDMLGMQAERARQGKLKEGRIARRIGALKVRGPAALLWKEAILQARGSLSGLVFLGTIFIVMMAFVMWSTASKPASSGWILLGAQGMMVYTMAMASAQSGFIELLRRVDLQKPLPFTPAVTVFWEVLSKAIAPTILGLLSALVGIAFAPWAWTTALAGILMTPALAIVLSAVVLLVIVLFPDMEDPTQRMFRGLMLLLGVALAVIPAGVVLVGGIVFLHFSPLVVALPVVAINVGIGFVVSSVAGNLYAGFNPSE